MAQKTIWHAVFEWFEGGVRHYAYRGETAEIPQDVIDQYAKFGVFDAPAEPSGADSPEDAAEAEPDDGAAETGPPSDDEPQRPPQAGAKQAWVEYAVAKGFDRAEADAMAKQDLIKAVG